MDMTILGRTGLNASIVALGAGGHSQLGLRRGASTADAVALVRAAIDRGVNIIDTAPAYGTEHVVGEAVETCRHSMIISSKTRPTVTGSSYNGVEFITREDVRASVDKSLRDLRTDYIDILHFHGVRPQQYEFCRDELLPELQRLRDEGKIRFFGITEGFGVDTEHTVMQRAVADGFWDVLMLGYNFVNPSAAHFVLSSAKENNLGVMAMYAVRGALASADTLKTLIQKLVGQGEVDAGAVNLEDPAGLLLGEGVAASLTEAAYRFCRHTPGIDVVMTGTGSLKHLDDNIEAINGPPLPAEVLHRLGQIFSRVRTATGDRE